MNLSSHQAVAWPFAWLFALAFSLPTGYANILGQHSFSWWDDPAAGVLITPKGATPPTATSVHLLDLEEWHLDQAQTTQWYAGAPITGLPSNPFNPANRTGIFGAPTPVANAEAFIYEVTNVNYQSGNGPVTGPPFSFTTPSPVGPGINDLSGLNIIDSGNALATSAPVLGSQFITTSLIGTRILDLTPSSVFGTPQDWDFNAYSGGGNFEWDIRSENGAGITSGLPPAVFGFAMPGLWQDGVNSGWIHSWNQGGGPPPTSIQVNIANAQGGMSGPIGGPGVELIPKWSQLPVHKVGENMPSDVDLRSLLDAPNWVIADDFRSDGRPILAIRWWGSYFNPENEPLEREPGVFVPRVEDAYIISFFKDIPANPDDPSSYSQPGELLGTYLAPHTVVSIEPTSLMGWDNHNVWEYEVSLDATFLDHAIPGLSEPDAFLEQAGEIYWISIVAENGKLIDRFTGEL
ncbi:MAG: hypothetical protein KDA60_21475, partial [Planctomycetales bacterium]|nr:hypothetical protein [Planctomycetales bacterium]